MRRVIRFKPELLDLVLKGVKTSTVRPVNGAEYGPDLILTDMLALLLVMTTPLPWRLAACLQPLNFQQALGL
jgi:hypothetical protein